MHLNKLYIFNLIYNHDDIIINSYLIMSPYVKILSMSNNWVI